MIITFYSYKGGTGRSMAVANTAWILASNGMRVLVVDWDLEAPGLHHYFHPFLPDRDLQSSTGVIDLMWAYAAAAVDPDGDDSPGWHKQYAEISPYAMSLGYGFPGGGTVDFVPAGRQDSGYSTLVSTFDWADFYDRMDGGAFLEELRGNMIQGYDYVLIDSRTGLSDTAGICTVQLPDVLVNCLTLSTQSIDGAAAVAASVTRQRRDRQLRIFPVPMRVEDGEQDKLEASRDYARERFGRYLSHVRDPERYWGEVEVPYKSFYAYEEILAPIGDRARQANTVLAAAERITGYLTDGRVTALGSAPGETERRRLLARFDRSRTPVDATPPTLARGRKVLISHEYESAESFDQLRDLWFQLRAQGIDVRLDPAPGERPAPWPATLEEDLAWAEVVLVVASPGYRAEVAGSPAARAARQFAAAAPGQRFVPVILPGRSATDIPEFLAAAAGTAVRVGELTPGGLHPLIDLLVATRPPAGVAAPRPPAGRPLRDELAEAMLELRTVVQLETREEMKARGMLNASVRMIWSVPADRIAAPVSVDLPKRGRAEDLTGLLRKLPRRRLVILGPPGSGKTSMALLFILRWPEDAWAEQVPVFLTLASWDPLQNSFEAWLAEELRTAYQVAGSGVAEQLISRHRVLPVLDGLDEMSRELRLFALQALNSSTDLPLVLTSRTGEYARAVTTLGPLRGTAVVEIEPLTVDDTVEYLRAGTVVDDDRWRPVFEQLRREPPPPLARVLSNPLMLSLARTLYAGRDRDPVGLLHFPDTLSVENHLLAGLIPDPAEGRWLTFLARFLHSRHSWELAWWELFRAVPAAGLRTLSALFGALLGVLFMAAASFIPLFAAVSPWVLLPIGAATGLVVSAVTPRTPPRGLVPSRMRSRLPSRLLDLGQPAEQLLREDRRSAFVDYVGLLVGVSLLLGLGPAVGADTKPFVYAVAAGATALPILGLARTSWYWFTLARLVLAVRHRLPWRLIGFLAEANARGILRRSGGSYQFRHARLQEYLASRF